MTAHRKSGTAKGNYAVGYGRPPREHRFREGSSGNVHGRPKGTKSISKVLAETLARRVTVQENGKPRRMRMLDVLIQRLINDAVHGSLRAMRLILDLCERYGDGTEQTIDASGLAAEDQAIIDSYLKALQPEAEAQEPASKDGVPTSSQNEPPLTE